MIFKIYLTGVLFLFMALIINGIALFIGLPTWYEFIANPDVSAFSYVWLFIVYPMGLGLLIYVLNKLGL